MFFSFFANVERISQPSYIPTVEDIIQTRIKTTGVHEISFNINKTVFKFAHFRILNLIKSGL